MKVSEFIEKLKDLPQDAEVVLCDSYRMAYEAAGEPSGEGLYYDFEVFHDDEIFFSFDDEEQENPISTVVISFETDYVETQNLIKELEKELN